MGEVFIIAVGCDEQGQDIALALMDSQVRSSAGRAGHSSWLGQESALGRQLRGQASSRGPIRPEALTNRTEQKS